MTNALPTSGLLQYLPAIYHEDLFIGQFLCAFEKVLLGRDPEAKVDFQFPGLEETIGGLAHIFDPRETPDNFLEWLAGWTAFSLRADLDIASQREFLANVIQLYRRRGTKANLQQLLRIFTVGLPTVTEATASEFQIGAHSTIGVDTSIGGAPAHFFTVTISLSRGQDPKRQIAIAQDLIEREKPAHTYYELNVTFPSIQLGKFSTIGVDTLLGTGEE